MTTWRWEAFDPDGIGVISDTLTDPFAGTVAEAADLAMAHLMVRAWPEVGVLAGWRVRAWADGQGEAWSAADEWLHVVEGVRG